MSIRRSERAAGSKPEDRGVAEVGSFVEKHGAHLLLVMQLVAGPAGAAPAFRLIDPFRIPGLPPRTEILEAIAALQAVLEVVPVYVEPKISAEGENHVPELDAAVSWFMARLTELGIYLRT
jgi:hypothetical protein